LSQVSSKRELCPELRFTTNGARQGRRHKTTICSFPREGACSPGDRHAHTVLSILFRSAMLRLGIDPSSLRYSTVQLRFLSYGQSCVAPTLKATSVGAPPIRRQSSQVGGKIHFGVCHLMVRASFRWDSSSSQLLGQQLARCRRFFSLDRYLTVTYLYSAQQKLLFASQDRSFQCGERGAYAPKSQL